jgi:hypothetical protein
MAKQKFIFDLKNEDHVAAENFLTRTYSALQSDGTGAEIEAIWTKGGKYPMPDNWTSDIPKSAFDKNDYRTLRRVMKAWMKASIDPSNLELLEWYDAYPNEPASQDFRAALRHRVEELYPLVQRTTSKSRSKQVGRRKGKPSVKPEVKAAVKILSERDTVEESIGESYGEGEISRSQYEDLMAQLQTLCINANAILVRNNPRRNRGGSLDVPELIPKTSRRSAEGLYVYPRRKAFPIGDLYHARLALIYVMSPTNRSSRRKVIKAVKTNYPQYNWNAWWRERTGQNIPR